MQETVPRVSSRADSQRRPRRRKKKAKRYLYWLIPVAALLVVYLAGALFFSRHFLPNTNINGHDAGGKSVRSVAAIASDRSAKSTLDLTTQEGEVQQVPLSSFSYDCWFDSDLDELRSSQSALAWPAAIFSQESWDVPLGVTFDESALSQALLALPCFSDPSIQIPVNAHIEKTENGFTVVDAVAGNALDYDKVWDTVTGVLMSGELSVDLAETGCYQKPTVLGDDPGLREEMSKWKQYEKLRITIDLTDAQEVLDGDTLRDWLQTDGSTITVDPEALGGYITDLANKYNTFETVRTFNATGVGPISVGGSGLDTYGFQMNIGKTQEAIQEAMDTFNSGTVAAVWRIPGQCRGAANGDIGGTYVEADLARQHLWYYQNGVLQYETDIVSGNNSQPGRRTPCGVFRVWGKQRDRTLKGDDYESFVHYWMPFTWTGCGLHDAPWRGAFGGTIYLHNGSHGCINLPSSAAATLYGSVAVDTPVIVYRSY